MGARVVRRSIARICDACTDVQYLRLSICIALASRRRIIGFVALGKERKEHERTQGFVPSTHARLYDRLHSNNSIFSPLLRRQWTHPPANVT